MSELKTSQLDLVVAGTEDAVLMVESEARELPEAVMLDAVMIGHQQMQTVIKAIKEMAAAVGKPRWDWQAVENDEERGRFIAGERRIDDRDTRAVRPITVRVGVLPRTHGSALFTRGETQALVVSTLGTARDAQMIDAIEGEYREPFMFHYNFPPYSVGETGMVGSPKRREIGHGRLAKRGVAAVMPDMTDYPYSVRVV